MDFFAGLTSGIRFPDARINGGGPLPTELSGPAGINGDADGLYNATGELLSGITPYAGPKSGRMGSDRNYQQIPHRVQYAVPKLFMPTADGKGLLELSHAVDNGDLAFVVRRGQRLLGPYWNPHDPMRKATPVLCNVVTANYLLAGVQRYLMLRVEEIGSGDFHLPDRTNVWWQLISDWGLETEVTGLETALHQTVQGYKDKPVLPFEVEKAKRLVRSTYFTSKLLRDTFVPFGVCAGSEKQGGLNETGLAPVQATCAHMTTLTVDGQNLDMVNIWRHMSVSSGDILCVSLKHMEVRSFTLNHYYKAVQRVEFPLAFRCAQIVPSVRDIHMLMELVDDPKDDINMPLGYWKVAQSMMHAPSRGRMFENNDTKFLDGALMQILFAPAWNRLQTTPCDFQMRDIMMPSDLARSWDGLRKELDANDEKPGARALWHIGRAGSPTYIFEGGNAIFTRTDTGHLRQKNPGPRPGKYKIKIDVLSYNNEYVIASCDCTFVRDTDNVQFKEKIPVLLELASDKLTGNETWDLVNTKIESVCDNLHMKMAKKAIEALDINMANVTYVFNPTNANFNSSNMGSPAWYYRGGQLHRCDATASGASGTADTAGTGPTDAEMVDALSEPPGCLTLRRSEMAAAPAVISAPAVSTAPAVSSASAVSSGSAVSTAPDDGDTKRRPDDQDQRPGVKKVRVVKKTVGD